MLNSSSKMLGELNALYTTESAVVCKKHKPLAAPIIIFSLISQGSGCGPGKQHTIH